MTKKETAKVIQRGPQLLSCREANILQTADWIQDYLQLNDKTLKKIIITNPSILGYSVTTLAGKTKYYQETFGWSIQDLVKVLTAFHIMSLSIEENLEPKRKWLHKTLNVTNDGISKLIQKNPVLLSANLDDMVDRLEFLQGQLELNSTEAIQKFVWKAPGIFVFTKGLLEEKIMWFQSSSLGLTKREMSKVIRSQPTLLASSIENNLEPTLQWLNDRFGQTETKNLVTSLPSILVCSVPKKLEPQLRYLQVLFELNETELSSMVCKLPSILGFTQTSLEEKLQFYATCVGSRPEALEFISRNPRLFSASLGNRLIPRWEQVMELDLPERGFTVPISILATYTNTRWELYLARRRKLIVNSGD
ncbi:mitochondrial transcription termination [Seminavis robusta]|uniref:Mitochondrial transcription termination n=1 Tax=Seminavis robusta TaxID=568900 RepID=A0A9N8ETZ3_9STRA|nr:mitochondrial transcription termination [Seminavis robusta]|eukprot:Sro1684_g291020.1 mitochondrial transcription termination (363) ;mRNA; f:16098-17186